MYDDMLSRFHTIPACHARTDRQTDVRTDRQSELQLLYQYRASVTRDIDISIPVCLSVTRWYCMKTA